MLKRLEVYVDAGLLSFAFSLIVLLAFAMGPGRFLIGLLGEGVAGVLGMVGPAAVVGGVLAIWASWVMHHRTTREPMSREESTKTGWVAIAAAGIALLMCGAYAAIGAASPVVWMGVAVALLFLAAILAVDAIMDLAKTREHRTLDVVRVLLIALLALSLVAGLLQPAQPGSEQDISLYVVGITVYMIVVALATFGYDEMVSWRKRSHAGHVPLSPSM